MFVSNWKMNFMEHIGLDCSVPCSMYSVLYEHKIIGDPYYGINEESLCDLSRQDCTFYGEFDLNESQLSKEKIELSFFGLDTICSIYLNGVILDNVKNMHRMYEYDIKALARDKNEIRLDFKSPINYFEKMDKLHYMYMNGDTIPGASHLRKAFYMSGWDWAPKLPDMGIFRPVTVECYDLDKIEDVDIIQHHENGQVRLEISATTRHSRSGLKLTCEIDGVRAELENGACEILIKEPRLWLPNGYGKQELYELTVCLYNGDVEIDRAVKQIGLRTLILSREDDEFGQEFCFKVNGIKIFAMGANYVPIDNLLPRISKERTEALIQDCIFANFNCIRVWGGAYYPDDYFYELCDKYGLIVWQDFMVACANIWLTEETEKEFILEATYNVKRIRHHACLGLLCGNNEMEEALCSWECADGNDPIVRRDYLKLYEEILPSVCKEHAPYISYTPSSPTSGGGLNNPQDYTRGDVHFWNVWNGGCELYEYRKHKFRFCSEYGFESLPSIKTIDSFCPREEKNLLSYTMESHQKHWHGNVKLLRYLAEEYQMPKDLETTVYASQLNQANAIKFGVEHFRRCRGYTMGSIYWQLNDPWPVASWSSVDYFGRYKALHYFARRFYQKVMIGLFNENGKIVVNVASEATDSFEGCLRVGVMKNDLSSVWSVEKPVSVNPLSSLDALEFSNDDFNGRSDFFFYAELYDKDGRLISRNVELGTKPKYFSFLKPNINIEARDTEGGVLLALTSDVLAKSVEVSFKGYDLPLSDNYFDLFSATPYEISVKTELSARELLKEISLLSIYDIPLRY
ncbi:MAG: glycoside hydrolase family 2 protein [Clostridia bacterium]|nr:glycoside hydrolase family 2 protein [Clostridia bacterium]